MMTKEKYLTLSVTVLKGLAKTRGIKSSSAMKKSELIEAMMELDRKEAEGGNESVPASASAPESAGQESAGAESAVAKAAAAEGAGAPEDASAEKASSGRNSQAKGRARKDGRKTEHKKADAAQGETAKADAAQGEAVKADAAQGEAAKTDAAQGEAAKADAAQGEAAKTDAVKNGTGVTETEKTGAGKAETGRRGRHRKDSGESKAEASPAANATADDAAVPKGMRTAHTGHSSQTIRLTHPARASQTGQTIRPLHPVHSRQALSGQADAGGQGGYTNQAYTAGQGGYTNQASPSGQGGYTNQASPSGQGGYTNQTSPSGQGSFMNQASSADQNAAAGQAAEISSENAAPMVGRPKEEGHFVRGILEVMQDGFGFIRSENFLPGEDDIYVSPSQIRRFNLKTGDMISGNTRQKAQGEKFGALLYVQSVNDMPAEEAKHRCTFESMTPIFPCKRIRLERMDGSIATRIVDLISPIGQGQRGMIVSPPKAGKTTLLKDIARSILHLNEEAYLIILLIDERPEEVTDMKESVHGKNVEIIYSTFDEMPEHHKRVSEMVIERAKRLVEHKKDVIILLDSITRLARAYNILVPPSGRTLSGGLDPTALYMPKRFFGAARNMREGGSLTILATALVDTGSKMDDVVYEEFKGTGNMELILDRKLQERRIFPAIDIVKSGTRREDLLLTASELEAVSRMRRALNGMKSDDAVESILRAFTMTRSNDQIVNAVLSGRLV